MPIFNYSPEQLKITYDWSQLNRPESDQEEATHPDTTHLVWVEPPMTKDELVKFAQYDSDDLDPKRLKFDYADSNVTCIGINEYTEPSDALVQVVALEEALVAKRGVTQVFRDGYENPHIDES